MKRRINLETICFFAVCYLVFSTYSVNLSGFDLFDPEPDKIKIWEEIFSKKIDFSEIRLYECLFYIGPLPKSRLQEFGDKKLHLGVINYMARWHKKFFNETFNPDIKVLMPLRYHLPINDEAAVLYYEWRLGHYCFSMYESYNGTLVKIKTSNLVDFTNMKPIQIAILLNNLFNLDYSTPEEIVKDFHLKMKIEEGDVYWNADNLKIYKMGDWKKNIVLLFTKHEMSVIFYKMSAENPKAFFLFDNTWLDQGLLELNGKTTVKAQKLTE